jgi:hypothetical protein
MASVTDISAVLRGESHVGLFSLVAAVKKAPSGTRVWELAQQRNGTRAKKLQLPVTDEGRVIGNRKATKIVSAAQIPIAARFVFTIDEAIAFFEDQTLVEALSELVRSCGGQEVEVQAVQDMATLVLSERDAAAQIQRELCPEATKLRITVQGDVVYGSIIDYLNFQLKLDGHNIWSNWLKADFEKWIIECPIQCPSRPNSVLELEAAAIIYHQPEGEKNATPMTTYQGFCYITRRCVGMSAVSDALGDEAVRCLSRYKVGDTSMHRELEENSRTVAPVEKAFVLGLAEAAAQTQQLSQQLSQQVSQLDCPPPEVMQKLWQLAIHEKSETLLLEEAGKRAVSKAEEEASLRKVQTDEEAYARAVQAVDETRKAVEEARARAVQAEEEARVRAVQAEEETRKAVEEARVRAVQAEEETRKAVEEARARSSKAEEETCKAVEEARVRASKAEEEKRNIEEKISTKLVKSRASAEMATISAGKKRDLTVLKAEELEVMERLLAAKSRMAAALAAAPVSSPAVPATVSAAVSTAVSTAVTTAVTAAAPVASPSASPSASPAASSSGFPAAFPALVLAPKAAKQRRLLGTGDNPDYVSYRKAYISDSEIPKDRQEADDWYKKALAIQIKNRPSNYTYSAMKLYDFGTRNINGDLVQKDMCCPPRRLAQEEMR